MTPASIRPEEALVSALRLAIPGWAWWPTRTGHVHGAREGDSEAIEPTYAAGRFVGWRWRGREWGLGEAQTVADAIRGAIGPAIQEQR